ncbi:uncharacterized protein ACA1_215950 [Acanthamoeba castellanii str. Neff]|uniref:Transglycosylase SLT domain-containing protein n=1 Tax=Acanthamoeba castellanii (strain ATCC 30010 / Neff) TaxID=1257118 RepID=L8GR46_ACACF|nr:uncharacterized protein ACA1_215950 [Acanthamoeba castellanii str. Neff]ELR15113.1 hypothetical protein ACA1_215950 [Acanthamoeba castellanii str. Neff]
MMKLPSTVLLAALGLVLLLCLPAVLADRCGGNCPSNNCNSCPCGTTPAYTDVASACRRFNGWSQSCCECIIRHESGGNLHAVNHNRGGSNDVGLWQINDMNWSSCNGGHAPCDLESNLKCAIKVWGWGHNSFRLWSTCKACGCC